jgi:DNA ligase (NAD+)
VVSGTLANLEREEAAERIRELGGTFQTSVGKTTHYLVRGDKPGASKVAKAEKLGTIILDEDGLLKLLNQK